MSKMCPDTNKEDKDKVYTPTALAKEIINHFSPKGSILEPCSGKGAFSNNMVCDTCEIDEGTDFFNISKRYDWIITNPPFSKLRQFMEHAFKLDTGNVVFLIYINGITTKARINLLTKYGYGIREICLVDTPAEWPATGFQLAAVHMTKGYHRINITRLNKEIR